MAKLCKEQQLACGTCRKADIPMLGVAATHMSLSPCAQGQTVNIQSKLLTVNA